MYPNSEGVWVLRICMLLMSLLAKQGLRVLQNENSLLQRIFKAKYFPNISFFESKLGETLMCGEGFFLRKKVAYRRM